MHLLRLTKLLVACLVISTIVIIPFKILALGFLPQDDVLRHAAKAVSGKHWNDIIVIRDDITEDNHPGWHVMLGLIHRVFHASAGSLVVFSICFCFLLFCLIPLAFLKKPECWPLALLVMLLASSPLVTRLLVGRPYILTMSVVLVLCFAWMTGWRSRWFYIGMTILMAASTWMHGSWHLLALPIACFFLAREWRAGLALTVCAVIGITAGSLLSPHPYEFLWQNLLHAVNAFSTHSVERMLVSEFRPFRGDAVMVMAVIGIMAFRKMRGTWNGKVIDNPVFILAACGWVLGFIAYRFWLDWGMPALATWMALELEDVCAYFRDRPGRRLALTGAICVTLFLAITNDVDSRWTKNLTNEYLWLGNPDHAAWLPEPGGIIYSDDMTVFFQTFYTNPDAPWRYILGFEPSLMRPEDLEVYRKIQWNFGAYGSFQPWIEKMTPADRLILRSTVYNNPAAGIPELEWNYTARDTWIGRLPKLTDTAD